MSLSLVSVLTPVYNGEKYLAECIESVLAQSYHNWEYIIINNCSTDSTLEIAQAYAEKDRRMRIHNNDRFVDRIENHNIALRQISAESKYCKVLHADDWLFPECISRMVDLAEANPSVGIVGAYGLDGVRVTWDGLPYPSTVTTGREICRRTLLGGPYVFGSPTSILFRSDLVRNCNDLYKSDEIGSLWADQDACYTLLESADFGFVHQVLTYSRTHNESVTSIAGKTGLNHDLPARLNMFKKYGRNYTSDQEYEKRLNQLMARYYSFLGRNLFTGKEFWKFHRRALSYLGYPLDPWRVLQAATSRVFETLLHPVTILAKLLRQSAAQ